MGVSDECGEAAALVRSFDEFYAIELDAQVRRAFLLTGSNEVANDVAHEAMLQVYRRWDELTVPGGYLTTAVLNGCRQGRSSAGGAWADVAATVEPDRHRFGRRSTRRRARPVAVQPTRCGGPALLRPDVDGGDCKRARLCTRFGGPVDHAWPADAAEGAVVNDVERRMTVWLQERADMAEPRPGLGAIHAGSDAPSSERPRQRAAVGLAAIALAVLGVGAAGWATTRDDGPASDLPTPASLRPEETLAASSATPVPSPTAVQVAGPPVDWQAPQARFSAAAFAITVNGRIFTPPADVFAVGGASFTTPTLEVQWMDGDVEMRWNVYFATDGAEWWVDEMRIYNGEPGNRADWLFVEGEQYRTALGQAFVGDLDVEFPIDGQGEGRTGRLQATGAELQGLLSRQPGDTIAPTAPPATPIDNTVASETIALDGTAPPATPIDSTVANETIALGSTTPTRTPTAPVTVVGGGFDLLAFPFAGFADSAAQLDALLDASTEPVDTAALGIDWASHAAIVLTIPTDLCPPLLAGLTISDRRAEPEFVGAGYSGCRTPLLSHTVIATVERIGLLDVDELVLPAEPSYFETPVIVPVDVTRGSPPSTPLESPAHEFGELAGTVALPRVGEVTVDSLDDGTPVYVVHHHDETVSVLDPRALDPSNESNGKQVLVAWVSSTRTFLAGGAWDEYGRRLDGFRASDLAGYSTRVDGDLVEVGAPVGPPLGSPIVSTNVPAAMSDAKISLDDPISFDSALALPVGNTALIDATVIVDPAGAFVCAFPSPDPAADTCPPGSPVAEGIEPEPGVRSVLFGPMLATRTEAGFTAIAPTGGYSGTAI